MGRREMHTWFLWGNLRERDGLEFPGIYRSIILKWIFSNSDGDMDWIDVAQDRDRWMTIVNLRVP
jgi:hypothetical protein